MVQAGKFVRRARVRRRLVHRRSILLVALIVSAFLLSGLRVGAENINPDPSFGDQGMVFTDFNEFDQINDIVIQPDGKIVVAGQTGFLHESEQNFDLMVARYNIDGSLDATFGNAGIVTTRVFFDFTATAITLQEDGKIVVGGTGDTSFSPRLALVRYNPDGSLDDTFGSSGISRERIGRSSRIMDLAIQSDGKIVVAGETNIDRRFDIFTPIVARFDGNGFLDFTFSSNGSPNLPPGIALAPMVTANSIALQVDQKIVIAGVCSSLQFCLARYDSEGALDNTFDGDGRVMTSFDHSASGIVAAAVTLQPDGKILAAGQITFSFTTVPVLARFNTDGSPDASFGVNGDGKVISFEIARFRVKSLALKPNGKIIIAGEGNFSLFNPEMAVARYTSDGLIEDLALTRIGDHAAANAVAIQPDGRIVAAGYGNFFASDFGPTFSDFALVRYGPNNAPVVTITSPASGSIFPVNTPVDFEGAFTDDLGDTHTAEWSFESITQAGTIVAEGSGSGLVTASHTFTEAGIYRVSLKVTDDNLLSGTATTVDGLDALVVIYDPNGGWVAGGGWIDSPAGAFTPDPNLTGKATFGFVSKYQNGASVPTGSAQFQFNAAGLKFQSSSYEWLVISGGRKAQYKGVGTINGSGNYRFMLTAIDGDQPGGGGQDKFRIKIWSDSDGLIYDNELNALDSSDSADPTTVLGGGNIVIHR